MEVRAKTPHSFRGNKQSVFRAGTQLAFWYPEGRSLGNFKGERKVNAIKNPLRDRREEEERELKALIAGLCGFILTVKLIAFPHPVHSAGLWEHTTSAA